MTTISSQSLTGPYSGKNISRIVGLTCLAGFAIDMLALGLPPNPGALEWRINFLQQLGDRSIILLIGAALVLYSAIDQRRLVKRLALACLVIGIVFNLFCILVIRDSLTLQQQAVQNINTKASELQTQIQQSQDSPNAPDLTAEQLNQASQLLSTQATTLKQNARTGITKAGIASVGNLVIVGLGLVSLGRYGSRLKK